MRKKSWVGVMLVLTSLIIMLLPVPEADAASSASDFLIDQGTLKKYKGEEKNVVLPSSVKVIGEGAFQNNEKIETLSVPDSVRKIEAYAFWGCDNLETVLLGKGLEEIGDLAFNNCTGLESIVIPSNVKRIGIQAFAFCQRLGDITIPPEVIEIREDSFDGDFLLNIHCEAGSYADKYAQEFYKRQKEMPVYELPAKKPSTDQPEKSPEQTEIVIEATGEEIGRTHVVGNQAVVLVQNVGLDVKSGNPTEGGEQTVPDTVPERAHYREEDLTEETIPEGVLAIAPFAYARSGLRRVFFPEGLEKIGYAAFYHCDDLAAVELPETVTDVSANAFAYTPWLENFLHAESASDTDNAAAGNAADAEPFLISGGVLVAYRGNAEELAVPAGVRVIAAEAFKNHAELKKVTLPDSLVTIGDDAFAGCLLETVDYAGTAIEEKALDALILQEQVSVTDRQSSPPVYGNGFQWKWAPALALFLVGGVCILNMPIKRLRVF